ncbi:MAG TPA: GNAT family N-acetyltransferase [Candidatus Latescibacteria bacterium]|jgi:ribosomal protein S18 acetylase RimI-like enzyme|nr:hypothetical protein [Gemmatimonadaceae bacterium]MDP6018148.1 GNAT family N-acetyltransferase [Candidatus Latescibacterota bacterium]HJP32406.1 GNAT family N-acetyltransferase [Candidatus Latescibacterota bacterium]
MSVRQATAADVPTLARLNRLVQEIHVAAEPEVFRMPTVSEVAAFFRKALSDVEMRAYVAEEEDVAVGYLLAAVRQRQEDAFRRGYRWFQIDQISVDPACQRQGHGRALLSAALDGAREAGIQGVETGVWAFNEPSLSFFEDQGFLPASLRLRR